MTLQAGRIGRGFTLIEILIVVTLLGVLAAIAVPAMNTYGKTARQATLVSTVHTLRGQIQAYRIQHGDELPDLAAASTGGNHFQPLTDKTTYNGQDRGPYLTSVPRNSLTEGSVVKNAVAFGAGGLPDPVPGADFIYDFSGNTGGIWGTSDNVAGTPVAQ